MFGMADDSPSDDSDMDHDHDAVDIFWDRDLTNVEDVRYFLRVLQDLLHGSQISDMHLGILFFLRRYIVKFWKDKAKMEILVNGGFLNFFHQLFSDLDVPMFIRALSLQLIQCISYRCAHEVMVLFPTLLAQSRELLRRHDTDFEDDSFQHLFITLFLNLALMTNDPVHISTLKHGLARNLMDTVKYVNETEDDLCIFSVLILLLVHEPKDIETIILSASPQFAEKIVRDITMALYSALRGEEYKNLVWSTRSPCLALSRLSRSCATARHAMLKVYGDVPSLNCMAVSSCVSEQRTFI